MRLLPRELLWTGELAGLAVAAFLVARVASTLAGAALEPAIDPRPPGRAPQPDARAQLPRPPALDVRATARLFGVVLPEPGLRETNPVGHPAPAPVRSSLRASLVGTMLSSRPGHSLSALRDDATRDVGVYLVGDSFLGAEIEAIERLRVILVNGGRREYLDAAGVYAGAVHASPAPGPVASRPGGDDVRCASEHECELSRSFVADRLANLPALAADGRIVPSIRGGVSDGFKLVAIRPGSLYSRLGLQSGDVIRRVNGHELRSAGDALELYAKLKESSRFELELERRGQPVRKSLGIR